MVGEIEIRPLDAEDDIFERDIADGNLCVGDICIDDDEVILFDREYLVFDEVIPVALDDIAQLRKGVGVRHAGPVVFIFGISHIKETQVERADIVAAHIISGDRHRNSSLLKAMFGDISLNFYEKLLLYIKKLRFRSSGKEQYRI